MLSTAGSGVTCQGLEALPSMFVHMLVSWDANLLVVMLYYQLIHNM